jgi:hypothetical protein
MRLIFVSIHVTDGDGKREGAPEKAVEKRSGVFMSRGVALPAPTTDRGSADVAPDLAAFIAVTAELRNLPAVYQQRQFKRKLFKRTIAVLRKHKLSLGSFQRMSAELATNARLRTQVQAEIEHTRLADELTTVKLGLGGVD